MILINDIVLMIKPEPSSLEADEAQGLQDMLQGLDVCILAHLQRQA